MGLFGSRDRRSKRGPRRGVGPVVEQLELRAVMDAAVADPSQLTPDDVKTLLQRAAAASASSDAIIAVVDRNGNILGVRVEGGVDPAITGNPEKLVFSVDGAVSEARTGAFFANNAAPLTSRTVQLISQSTIVQREVDSDPNIADPNSTERGPGFVAPVGVKGHFPPGVMFTPQVDLFLIEHTNRDSLTNAGPDLLRGTADDVTLPNRFNVSDADIPAGASLTAPESFGANTSLISDPVQRRAFQSRGIATLPGGIPLYKNGMLVGGIGVFFPGTTGYATAENSQLNDAGLYNPKKRDRAQEAEFMAFVAAGGSKMAGYPFGAINGAPALKGFTLPFGRIDLVGITLDLFGGHGLQGIRNLLTFGRTLGKGDPNDGTDEPVNLQGDQYVAGQAAPSGWLVTPHDAAPGAGNLTAADVTAIVNRGIAEANQVRAAIRLPLNSTAKMVFAVSDKDGNILGLYRMADATTFSIDVAVAKARNVAYYDDPAQLQPQDKLTNIPAGVSFTSRTFRYVTLPHFPEGIDINPSGPFSILNDPGIMSNGLTQTALPPSSYTSIQGHDAFYPGTNFHDPFNPLNQNGIVFFPGSSALYKDQNGNGTRSIQGGLGVSGDGVDQDDVVSYVAVQGGYTPPSTVATADMVTFRGVRLPYQKFNRNPHVPLNQPKLPIEQFKNIPAPRLVHRRRKS